MKILRNAATFEILTPSQQLRDQLLIIETAGRTCYQSETGRVTTDTAPRFVAKIMKRGHESVIEHGSMTVRFSDVSRGFTHQVVRHRIASYSQESTRYVDESDLHFVMPPHRDDAELMELYDDCGRPMGFTTPASMVARFQSCYRALLHAGWKREDARQFLPIGTRSQIVVTANFREWRHIFAMRASKPAHWEIRGVIGDLLASVQETLSPIFDDFRVAGTDANGVKYWERT